jgi:hypothetical protein
MRSLSKATALAAGLFMGLGLFAPGRAAADPSPLAPAIISNYGESETPRSAAMGGALRALGFGSAGIFLNPAALAEARVYHIEAMTSGTPETRTWLLGGTVVDAVTSRLAGAFSIQGTPIAMDPSGIDRTSLDMRIGLAYPITDSIFLGVTGRYLKVDQSGVAAPTYGFGWSAASGGLVDPSSISGAPSTANRPDRFSLVNTATFDVGFAAKPIDSLTLAAVGQNLTYANNGFLPLTIGGGVGYSADLLSVEVDGLADLSSWGIPGAAKATARIMGGVEYLLTGVIPLRGGFRYDEGAKLGTLSLGTGYVGSVFAIEGAVKRTLSAPGATGLFFSVAYYLESSGIGSAKPLSDPQ